MTEIINLGELARLKTQHKAEIAARDEQIDALSRELKEAKVLANSMGGISTMLSLQLSDLSQTVRVMQDHLNTIQANILEMKAKLPR